MGQKFIFYPSDKPIAICKSNRYYCMSVWPFDNEPRMGLFKLYLIEFLFFFFLYFKVITRLAGMEEVPISVDSITIIPLILIAFLSCNRGQGEGRDIK